jgi:Tfp pilus assembly protein PilO
VNRVHWIVVGGMAAGLAGLVFAGWQFFVHPLSAEYTDAVAKKEDLEQQLQTAKETAAQFDKFKAQAENMRRDLEFYSSRTDDLLNRNEVYQLVYGVGNALNLRDWTVDVKEPVAAPGSSGGDMSVCKVEVRFKADYEHLGRLLNGCLGQKRLIVPDTVTIRNLDDPTGVFTDTVDVVLDLSVYGGKAKVKS